MEIEGTIDVYSVGALGEVLQSLIAERVKHIVVDVANVPAIDSSGLGTLVGNAKELSLSGGEMWLVGCNQRISRMLEVTRLERYFRRCRTQDEVFVDLGIAMPAKM